MSYVVHFWTFPMPGSVSHAMQIHAELQERRNVGPVFRTLAQRLTARYPCITTCDADDDDNPPAWSDGPLDGDADCATYGIGLNSERLEEVHPFVVETATSLGLVVLDEQQGHVYLPGGRTLTLDGEAVGRHLGHDLEGAALTPRLVEQTVMDALLPLLGRAGFEPNRGLGGLMRSHANGTQWLRYHALDGEPGTVAFDVDLLLTDNRMRRLYESLLKVTGNTAERHVATATSTLARLCRFFRVNVKQVPLSPPWHFRLESVDDLRAAAISLRRLAADHLLDMLDQCQDLVEIERRTNGTGFDVYRSLGSARRTGGGSLTVSLIGGAQLVTTECGGPVASVLLAACCHSEHFDRLVETAHQWIGQLPEPQRTREDCKLQVYLENIELD